jgi:hypothetical protein
VCYAFRFKKYKLAREAKKKADRKLSKSTVYGVSIMYSGYVRYQYDGDKLNDMIKKELGRSSKSKTKDLIQNLDWLSKEPNYIEEAERGTYLCFIVATCLRDLFS